MFGLIANSADESRWQQLVNRAQSALPGTDQQTPGQSADRRDFCAAPFVFEDARLAVALRGQPLFSDVSGYGSASNPALRVAQLYLRDGKQCLKYIYGAFALSIVDRQDNSALLALDRMGIEQLSYAVQQGELYFSSAMGLIAGILPGGARLQAQAVFDYLLLHMVPAPGTVYRGISKLRAGEVLSFCGGAATISRYWMPEFADGRAFDLAASSAELKRSLRLAVAACTENKRSGAFLSGGLDSSSVAGMLCQVRGALQPTFSIGFGVDAYNEIEFARIASRHFNSQPHEYHVTADDVVTAFHRIAAAYDEPFGNSSAVPTYFCAKLAAEHGVHHLLAGDGGDEIFGGNERYARQKVFEAYQGLPRLLRSGLVEPIARLIDAESPITPLRKFRSYVDQASTVMPERLESWNFMYRTDLGTMLDEGFRDQINSRSALANMSDVYHSSSAKALVDKMLFYDWQFTLSDNDLRKVGTMCGLAGVTVSYPMLDPRLVDLSLRVSPSWKVRRFELRAFYKHAMADFLPAAIIRKTKHGFGLPFGTWLKTHGPLADLIYGLLCELKQRSIVKPGFLDQLIKDHRAGHPNFFGYAIWDLAMLEAWLQSHRVGF
jgi:asparagine synthase (glutamine-hydrolysing)